jgi:hypothetical protein
MTTEVTAYCIALCIAALAMGVQLGIVLGVRWVRRFELPTVRQEGIVEGRIQVLQMERRR